MNSINVIGRLTQDPKDKLRYTQQGTAVCNVSIAVDDSYKDDQTHFFEIVCWGKRAENVAEYLDKGRKVAVTGELKQNRWENEQGQNRSKVVINARNVQFLDYGDNDKQSEEEEQEDIDVPF